MTPEGESPPLRLAQVLAEPSHLWIRYRPRRWPGFDGVWMDLTEASLGRTASRAEAVLPGAPSAAVDDVVYLPPVAARLEPDRARLAETLLAQGTPVIYQVLAGQRAPESVVHTVHDLTAALLASDLERLDQVTGCAVWGLISGITDCQNLIQEGLDRLHRAGAREVIGMVPSLRRSERRALTEDGDEALFRALFHGPAPSLDRFARAVHAAGLSPFFPRPLPSGAGRLASNRKLSSGLTLAGELWLRLGRPESHAQVLFRAARKIDRDTHDLARLATEGNLGVVKWLDPDSREVVRQLSTRGRSDLLEALRAEYLSDSAS